MKPVVIFGIGDFGRTAMVYMRDHGARDIAAFTVTQPYLDRERLLDLPVIAFETIEQSHPPEEFEMFVAIGFSKLNRARAQVYDECKAKGYTMTTYVDPRAMVAADVVFGDNCFVFESNVIQPSVTIGNDVVLWSGNHIGHDSRIADHCFISSHVVISGNVSVGEFCFLGVNATVRDGVTIASRSLIGAAAVVMHDTAEGDVLAVRATPPHEKKSWELDF